MWLQVESAGWCLVWVVGFLVTGGWYGSGWLDGYGGSVKKATQALMLAGTGRLTSNHSPRIGDGVIDGDWLISPNKWALDSFPLQSLSCNTKKEKAKKGFRPTGLNFETGTGSIVRRDAKMLALPTVGRWAPVTAANR